MIDDVFRENKPNMYWQLKEQSGDKMPIQAHNKLLALVIMVQVCRRVVIYFKKRDTCVHLPTSNSDILKLRFFFSIRGFNV